MNVGQERKEGVMGWTRIGGRMVEVGTVLVDGNGGLWIAGFTGPVPISPAMTLEVERKPEILGVDDDGLVTFRI